MGSVGKTAIFHGCKGRYIRNNQGCVQNRQALCLLHAIQYFYYSDIIINYISHNMFVSDKQGRTDAEIDRCY